MQFHPEKAAQRCCTQLLDGEGCQGASVNQQPLFSIRTNSGKLYYVVIDPLSSGSTGALGGSSLWCSQDTLIHLRACGGAAQGWAPWKTPPSELPGVEGSTGF